MRAAVIKDNTVTNIIEVIDGYGKPVVLTGDLPVQIGDSYDGTDFYRDGEKVTEHTGLQEESNAITEEYIAALETLGVEVTTSETN